MAGGDCQVVILVERATGEFGEIRRGLDLDRHLQVALQLLAQRLVHLENDAGAGVRCDAQFEGWGLRN